jgi:hypothetical protein
VSVRWDTLSHCPPLVPSPSGIAITLSKTVSLCAPPHGQVTESNTLLCCNHPVTANALVGVSDSTLEPVREGKPEGLSRQQIKSQYKARTQ